jgi:two-component system, NtrC family, nitrogen regulation response regulator NtrX
MSLATVLLVDDEPNILDVTRESIEDYFHEVLTAQGVAQALEILGQRRVDIVVCDYKMPRKDGLELRRQIQQKYPHVQFVLLTGYGADPQIVEMLQNETFEVLDKPVSANVLIDRLKSKLDKQPTVNAKIETYKLALKPNEVAEFEKLNDQAKLRVVALHDSLRKRQLI